MWGTEVLSKKNGFKAPPTGSPAGFRSPSAGQASFPDLKTRCLEHQWLQNKPNLDTMDGGKWTGNNSAPNKDSFCPATRGSGGMPWVFNQGYQSAPVSVFFDGHIGQLGVAEAADSWSRVAFGDAKETTPPKITGTFVVGGSTTISGNGTSMPNGYSNGATYDNGAEFAGKFVSYHVLTAGGIQGRDTIGQK